MPSAIINRQATPGPDPTEPTAIYANTGQLIGTLRYEFKGGTTSRLEYAPDQTPHRTYPLKAKHRQR